MFSATATKFTPLLISVPDSSRAHRIFIALDGWKAVVQYREPHIYGQKFFTLVLVLS